MKRSEAIGAILDMDEKNLKSLLYFLILEIWQGKTITQEEFEGALDSAR